MKLLVYLHFLYAFLIRKKEDRWMREDIREGVRRYVIDDIRSNFAALARQYNCDYRTVQTAYEEAKKPKAKQAGYIYGDH